MPIPCLKRTWIDLAEWLTGIDRPTAIIGEDFRMMAAKRAANSVGLKVPRDLEVVGLGNTPWAQAENFSSVSHCEDVIAGEIAKLILADDKELGNVARHVVVPPQLIIR